MNYKKSCGNYGNYNLFTQSYPVIIFHGENY
jgi:hypothetical protein